MATIDNILDNPGSKKIAVSPPPLNFDIEGAPNTVGSKPATTQKMQQGPQQKKPENASEETIERPKMSYADLYQAINPYKPETPEETAKREKRERGEKIIAAVGDGISALSNLYFTTKYAPHSFKASQGMSAKSKERWDKLKAQREANHKAYFNGYLQALAMDDANDKDERNWRHTLDRDKKADQYRDAKDKRDEDKAAMDAQLAKARLALQLGKLDYQGYQNEIAKIKADYQPKLMESTISRNNRVGSSIRSGGGTGQPGEYPWYDSDGNLHYAHSYEAMRQNALLAGTWEEATQQSVSVKTSPNGRRGQKETKTVRTTPAKGNSKKPENNNNNTMPGVGGKSKTMPGVKA